jgi:uncharacterized repeat protein (TIGR03806 family)
MFLNSAMLIACLAGQEASHEVRPHGLQQRPAARPYLGLPASGEARPPALLSQTGAFEDTKGLNPSPALIPYDVLVPFWSDGAEKTRWIAVPGGPAARGPRIRVSSSGAWTFPAGTVFVKHFEIPIDDANPPGRRRLETRLLVVDAGGGVCGYSYRWKPDETDAELLDRPLVESIRVRSSSGPKVQTWAYPGPGDCRQCHSPASGGVLGVNARQLHRETRYPGGAIDDQVRTWATIGLLEPTPTEFDIRRLPRLASPEDRSRSLEERARSYLDANCAYCHMPGGVAADFDARFTTPLDRQRILGEPARINLGIDGARVIAPKDPWRSTILARMTTLEPTKMPPLAHEVVDARGLELLRAWIATLSGPPVLEPPRIRPRGGDLRGKVRVVLEHDDPSATIRYSLDGSSPGQSSPVYSGPLEVLESTTVRARAYRPGWKRSIAAQETYLIDQ